MPGPAIRQRARAIDTTPTAAEVSAHQASLTEKQHEGRVYVQRSAYGDEHHSEERVLVPFFEGPVARVGITASTTRNLGDYNSARVEVMIELPCHPELSEVRRTAGIISDMLDEIIPTEQAKAGFPQQ